MRPRRVALVVGDIANLRRDPMLAASLVAPLLVAVALRFGIPALPESVGVTGYLSLVLGLAVLLAPFLAGFAVGFLLLEEREDRILDAVAVTPIGVGGFLSYRLLLPMVAGGAGAAIVAILGGISPLGGLRLAGAALLAAGSAGLMTMSLAVLGRDRVQGLAIAKLMSFALVAAVAFQLLPGPWRWLLAPVPQVWVLEVVAGPEPVAFSVATGGAAHLAVGGLLWRRLRHVG